MEIKREILTKARNDNEVLKTLRELKNGKVALYHTGSEGVDTITFQYFKNDIFVVKGYHNHNEVVREDYGVDEVRVMLYMCLTDYEKGVVEC